jgi:hypothetical protein
MHDMTTGMITLAGSVLNILAVLAVLGLGILMVIGGKRGCGFAIIALVCFLTVLFILR